MSKSTKEQFYNFVDQVMDEVNTPPVIRHDIKLSNGQVSNEYKSLIEYEENMQLRIVLTIICSAMKEGKLQELYWQLKDKYL